MKSHCVFSFKTSFSFEDRRDRQFGIKLSLSCLTLSLSLSLLPTTNVGVEEQQLSFLNVQIFINYQNVNFRDQKQMQITKIFFFFFLNLSFWTRNTDWESLLFSFCVMWVYIHLFCSSVCTECHLRNWNKIDIIPIWVQRLLHRTVSFRNPPPL